MELLWDQYNLVHVRLLCREILIQMKTNSTKSRKVIIDWKLIAKILQEKHAIEYRPDECQRIWKFIAYQKEFSRRRSKDLVADSDEEDIDTSIKKETANVSDPTTEQPPVPKQMESLYQYRLNGPILDTADEEIAGRRLKDWPAEFKSRVPLAFATAQAIPSRAKVLRLSSSQTSSGFMSLASIQGRPKRGRPLGSGQYAARGQTLRAKLGMKRFPLVKRKSPITKPIAAKPSPTTISLAQLQEKPPSPKKCRTSLHFYKQHCISTMPETAKMSEAQIDALIRKKWSEAPNEIRQEMNAMAYEDRCRFNRELSRLKRWEQQQLTIKPSITPSASTSSLTIVRETNIKQEPK